MNISLNEVEATACKAARGAGYTWGVADEAGKAVRWLCANDVDGCAAFATLMREVDAKDLRAMTPDHETTDWASQSSLLCPLMTGCALADFGIENAQIGQVAAPLLVLPFVAMVALAKPCNMALETDHGAAVTDGQSVHVTGDLTHNSRVVVRRVAAFSSPNQKMSRAMPRDGDWATLHAFAHRTYAPATEESRLKGAG